MKPKGKGISIRDSIEISAKTLRVTELLDATVHGLVDDHEFGLIGARNSSFEQVLVIF